jgi:hypothetical protein
MSYRNACRVVGRRAAVIGGARATFHRARGRGILLGLRFVGPLEDPEEESTA